MPRGGMPGTSSRWQQYAERAVLVVAQLSRAYVLRGRPYIDAINPDGPGKWFQVPVVQGGGGGETRWENAPIAGPQEGSTTAHSGESSVGANPDQFDSAQVVLMFVGNSTFPRCVGVIDHPRTGLVEETPETEAGEDREVGVGPQDWAWVNGGSRWILDSKGLLTAIAAQDKKVSFQLAGDGFLRVSVDGEADEKLLLAGPVRDYLAELESHLDAQEARIAALEAAMALVAPQVTAPVQFTPAPGVSRPTADDTMVSSVVHISSKDNA